MESISLFWNTSAHRVGQRRALWPIHPGSEARPQTSQGHEGKRLECKITRICLAPCIKEQQISLENLNQGGSPIDSIVAPHEGSTTASSKKNIANGRGFDTFK